MVLIDVRNTSAVIHKQEMLTGGMVGAVAEFRFYEDWNGLTKTAVFRAGKVTKDVVNVGSTVRIPPEVLIPGYCVEIGVYGVNDDGTLVIPTVWVKTNSVKPGADPSGDESTDPSLPVWAQVQNQANEAVSVANSVREDADSGKFNGDPGPQGPQGVPGDPGPAGYTPQKGVDYLTEQDYEQLQSKLSAVFVSGDSQSFSEDQKAQARQNIGAMATVADSDFDMNHKKIVNVTSLEFDQGIGLSATGSVFHHNGVRLYFSSNFSPNTIGLSNIADGIDDTDAATVGQLNSAVGDIETALDSIIAIQESLIGGASV